MTDATYTRTLPVLPLAHGVVLPQMVVTIAVESDEARRAVDAALESDGELLLVPRVDGRFANVGVTAKIESSGELPGRSRALLIRATGRAKVGPGVLGSTDALWVEATPVVDPPDTDRDLELAGELRATFRALLDGAGGRQLGEILKGAESAGALADLAGWWPDLDLEQKVELLETLDVTRRVETVLAWAKEALAEEELSDRIRREVSEGMERNQREFILRQQLDAIRKELGETSEEESDGYRGRLEELRAAGVDAAVLDAVERELARFERTPEQSVEHGWIRTWLDTVLEVPWTVRSEEHLDVESARSILDADHTGLDEVKERIVEFLAVRKLRSERGRSDGADDGRRNGTPVLALVGPPGVGKTSLGESVARAMGRAFVRIALGGVRDEAEVRGHRRTYVGAQPGRLVRAIREAGSMNPVVLLDEIDKVGADWRGDPSSALLEVLDPAQNHTFRDHYLEVDLDLSDVVFIATANAAEQIPPALADRLEMIRLDGYTESEKVVIAREHLLPRQLRATGLEPDEVQLSDEALESVIADHTREAGVRSLERALGKVLRKVAAKVASGEPTPVEVGVAQVRELLGRARFDREEATRGDVAGVATGLAVTGAGGDVLQVEATAMPGDPSLVITGQLGDVMRESAEIALSYVRSRAPQLGIDPDALERRFHVHFPAGAIPKDGPSAGITITSALVSLLTGRPVRPEVGMTGEVTLQGRVLPIGGVKQKVLAAHRAGLTEVVLPERNGADLDDVPDAVREAVRVHLVSDVADVLDLVLAEEALAAA